MCNLNILITSKKARESISADKRTAFMQSVTSNSYASNDDAEGIFFSDDYLVKGVNKINLFDCKKHMNSDFIIAHERIATSGRSEKYSQPFENSDFVLAHNGVISSLDKDGHSDTYNLFIEFNNYFSSLEATKKRKERVVATIKHIFEEVVQYGSYSIALYDKEDKKMYYFKNSSTSINFFRLGNCLYITTLEQNFKFTTILSNAKDWKEYKIEDGIIYECVVHDDGSLGVYKDSKIKTKAYDWSSNFKVITKTDNKEDNTLAKPPVIVRCDQCGEDLHHGGYRVMDGGYVTCDDCVRLNIPYGCKETDFGVHIPPYKDKEDEKNEPVTG